MGLGKQTLRGHKQNLMCTRTQKKGATAPHKADPDLPVSIQESLAVAWVRGGVGPRWPVAGCRALGVAG